MNDPHIWWYVTRASAMVAWALMTMSVLWGILLSTRIMRKIDNPGWLADLHSYLGGASIVMILVHMLSLMLDGWLKFSIVEVVVPFATDYRTLPVALGIVSFYLLVSVQLTSIFMSRLPRWFWRATHYTSYIVLLFVSLHASWTGTDVGALWYRIASSALIGVAVFAVVMRVFTGTAAKRAGGASAPARGRSDGRRGAGGGGPATAPVRLPTPAMATAGPAATATSPATALLASPRTAETETAGAITVMVEQVYSLTSEIVAVRFGALNGADLPPWQPGSNITVYLPNGMQRQYSLAGDARQRRNYDIAVLLTKDSTGGSRFIHQNLAVGTVLTISEPRNHFALEPADDYVFIAGGIGITPIVSMIASLAPDREWLLIYFGRTRAAMAYLGGLLAAFPDRVIVRASDEPNDPLPLADILTISTGPVYSCGPEGLMASVADYVPAERLRVERFTPETRVSSVAVHDIRVTCSRSRRAFDVGPDQSILEAMERGGVPVVGSCRKGVCGTCEVRVSAGVPEHLDSVMEDRYKDRLGVMYPCVSRSRTPELVLDV